MKAQLETISNGTSKSFSIMFNPRLNDLFFWHLHPEYELIYIEANTGTRHVGEHISTYKKNDLVLIGSNIPHLNFDYGIRSEYKKVVVHLNKDFIEKHFDEIPELFPIKKLFKTSNHGIAFKKNKRKIGKKLFQLKKLSPFNQYFQLVEIFKMLSKTKNMGLLHEKPYNNQYSNMEQKRLMLIYTFIDKNYHRKIGLDEIAEISFMNREAFCRFFKKITKCTFTQFLNRYRISHSKRYLMLGKSVSDACYHSGFESLSYYNRIFRRITKENPRDFRSRYL